MMAAAGKSLRQREPGMWWRALLCLALAGAVFVGVYSSCNRFTAGRTDVGECYFSWEPHVPFVPWLVVPYWSLDLFYCISFRPRCLCGYGCVTGRLRS